MAGILGCFELARQVSPGKNEPVPLALALALLRRELWTLCLIALRNFSLLLFDRLTLPTTCHYGNPTE